MLLINNSTEPNVEEVLSELLYNAFPRGMKPISAEASAAAVSVVFSLSSSLCTHSNENKQQMTARIKGDYI